MDPAPFGRNTSPPHEASPRLYGTGAQTAWGEKQALASVVQNTMTAMAVAPALMTIYRNRILFGRGWTVNERAAAF